MKKQTLRRRKENSKSVIEIALKRAKQEPNRGKRKLIINNLITSNVGSKILAISLYDNEEK